MGKAEYFPKKPEMLFSFYKQGIMNSADLRRIKSVHCYF